MIYAIAAVLVLILDQAVKFYTTKNIFLDAVGADCVELIPGIVHMTNVHNYGAAFSILQNARWFLIVMTIVFVVGIIILINQEIIHTKIGRWTTTMIVAGAIGNCIDRILYGYVVDMFEFEFMNFPVFNVADIFITLFGILFCIHVVLYNEPEEVKAANEPAFMRRRREAREEKEAPYAAIPKRGEHKTLEEELRAEDPEDLFGEWGFGDVVEEAAPEEEIGQTISEPEPEPEPVAEYEPEPEIPVQPEMPSPAEEMFSLEDILSEFGDY